MHFSLVTEPSTTQHQFRPGQIHEPAGFSPVTVSGITSAKGVHIASHDVCSTQQLVKLVRLNDPRETPGFVRVRKSCCLTVLQGLALTHGSALVKRPRAPAQIFKD